MVFQVQNFIITIHNPKGTSKTRYAPKYEVPLIEALFANSAPGKVSPRVSCKKMPEAGSPAARDKNTGRDRFAGMRVTRVGNLADEKKRLQHFYGDDARTQKHIFNTTYPVDTFDNVARTMYPDIFGDAKKAYQVDIEEADDEIPDDTDYEDDGEERDPDEVDVGFSAPESETAESTDAEEIEVPEEKIEELIQLKYVGEITAKSLFAAGFTSIEEIAQTDPLDIETVDGVGSKEAKAIVDHAIELSGDSDDIADIME